MDDGTDDGSGGFRGCFIFHPQNSSKRNQGLLHFSSPKVFIYKKKIGTPISIKSKFHYIYFSNYFLSIIVSVVCITIINIFEPRPFNLEFQHFISIFIFLNHFVKKNV
jgi:hypothetical protein